MSDPIVVDDVVKVPPSGPKLAAVPRPEPAKADVPKADPPAAKSAGPFPPPKPPAGGPAHWLGKVAASVGVAPTKRTAAIAASAALSLAAGIGLMRAVWPSGGRTPPAADQPLTARAAPPTETPPPPTPSATDQTPKTTTIPAEQEPAQLPPILLVPGTLPRPERSALMWAVRSVYEFDPTVPPEFAALAPTSRDIESRGLLRASTDDHGRQVPQYGPSPLFGKEVHARGLFFGYFVATWARTRWDSQVTANLLAGLSVGAEPSAATPPGAAPTPPLPPPTVFAEVTPGPLAPRLAPPESPTRPATTGVSDPQVRTAGVTEPVKPAFPATPLPDPVIQAGGGVPLPPPPPGGIALPAPPPGSAVPVPPMMPSVAPPSAGPGADHPAAADLTPKPALPAVPNPSAPGAPMTPPKPDPLALPSIPGAGPTAPPPAAPQTPPSFVAPQTSPGGPAAAPLPPPVQGSPVGSPVKLPDVNPMPSPLPDPGGRSIQLTKPADSPTPLPGPAGFPAGPTARPAGTEVRPVVAERPAQTSFDVDVYEPRAGDTYEAVAREFYHDTRYARALQEYNARRPIQPGRSVDVPPLSVLRQRYATMIGTPATPTNRPTTGTVPAGEWGPANPPKAATETAPTFRPAGGGSQTFKVPPGGMTLKAVARQTLGTDGRWGELYELNPQVDPNAVAADTVLKLPADARTSP